MWVKDSACHLTFSDSSYENREPVLLVEGGDLVFILVRSVNGEVKVPQETHSGLA